MIYTVNISIIIVDLSKNREKLVQIGIKSGHQIKIIKRVKEEI